MTTTRRNLFKFLGGSAVGVLFTPAPWRLVTDAALWSENWPGIPKPLRGEIRARYTNCSLCQAGCAMRARCVGQQPVSLAGVAAHPMSRGALCPWGIAAHQLAYHPNRLRQGPVEQASAAVKQAIAGCGATERVAVLDLRPGRTASWTYRRALAALPNGTYVTPPQAPFAVDLASAKTVVSFGAPLLDGWGTPGNVFAAREHFRLIQVEPVESRTAALADRWLPIRPGTEGSVAAMFAGEITEAETARVTGIPEAQLTAALDDAKANGPALFLARDLQSDLMAHNTQLVTRGETPVPEAWKKATPGTSLEAIPNGSIRVLLIDESTPGEYLPWSAIEPKLAPHATVVTFAWTREGYGRHAQFVLPAPVFGEAVDDIPAAIDSVTATFRLANPLAETPAYAVNPVEFISKLAGLSAAEALRERSDAIHKAAKGTLFTYADAKSTAVKELDADAFWKALNEGASWTGDTAPAKFTPANDVTARTASHDSHLPYTVIVAEMPAVLASPVMTKLYQESNLRQARTRIAMSPKDAKACQLNSGGAAMLETVWGRLPVTVMVDAGTPAGVVQVAAGPELLDLCGASARGKVVRI